MKSRVVFDTNVIFSAVMFPKGALAWLKRHWADGKCVPLVSVATVAELTEVLGYSKFRLPVQDRYELLAKFLPYSKTVEIKNQCPVLSRDQADQPFLDLAHCGGAETLVTGDRDLLVLAGSTQFSIETPAQYRQRFVYQ